MFKNEVLVSKQDKETLCSLMKQVNNILDKYPYQSYFDNTITAMSRAKTSAKEAEECIKLIYTD